MRRSRCNARLLLTRPAPRLHVGFGLLVGIALVLVRGAPVLAQSTASEQPGGVPSTECCNLLLFPIGARALALGQALAARQGADALFLNPSALGGIGSDQLLVHTSSGMLERAHGFSLVFRSEIAGSFGVSYRLFDHGDLDATDQWGTTTGELSTLEHVLVASYATRVVGGLSAGISYKLYQLRQDCRGFCLEPSFSATTHGIDAGAQYAVPRIPLRLGVAMLHVGFPLQVINAEQADPLPSRLRVGAAYEALHHVLADSTVTLWLSADVMSSWRNRHGPVAYFGAEAAWENAVFVRAGYAGGSELLSGAGIGIGLRYDRFDISVARSFGASPFGEEPFQFTFVLRL
jgi:hypothetical protein